MKVRTRIAPSPTGYPHIGTIYQALFNYAFAKKYDGSFLVRIEDTDRERFVADAEEKLFKALDWFGLSETESPRKEGECGPYRQSERLSLYHQYAQQLIDNGHAYFSYFPKKDAGQKKEYSATTERTVDYVTEQQPPATIAEMITRGDWVVRMVVPKNEKITFTDAIRGEITIDSSEVSEQVLIKSDGFPTYHLAVVVDDHLMGITHAVRAEEWISSTPKHVLLYRYFNWEAPLFFHTALLRNPDKSKLSKRHGHTDVTWYKNEGYLPEAILNFLALMGWGHPEEKEVFSFSEFIQLVELKDMKAVGPIFDLTKLTWMNQQYMQMKTDKELQAVITDFYPEAKKLSQEIFDQLLPLVKTRMKTLKEFAEQTAVFFVLPAFTPLSEKEQHVAKKLEVALRQITEWHNQQIFETMKAVMTEEQIKMPLLYRLFTGKERGLPLPQILEILGKEHSVELLKKAQTA